MPMDCSQIRLQNHRKSFRLSPQLKSQCSVHHCHENGYNAGLISLEPVLEPALDLQQLQALLQITAHWAQDRMVDDLQVALLNSDPVVSAWWRETLVGFARATSDGVYRATIWDVVVHPEFQGGGIGRKLVTTILSHPHVNRVERVYLMTTHQQQFYERIGFETNNTTTMVLHNQVVDSLELAGRSSQFEEIEGFTVEDSTQVLC